ncbi:MAG: hypothetical protein KGS46_13870 [Chloroflexi bacterium]|nr:hypothetical protein [Chloroflexota bacterium]
MSGCSIGIKSDGSVALNNKDSQGVLSVNIGGDSGILKVETSIAGDNSITVNGYTRKARTNMSPNGISESVAKAVGITSIRSFHLITLWQDQAGVVWRDEYEIGKRFETVLKGRDPLILNQVNGDNGSIIVFIERKITPIILPTKPVTPTSVPSTSVPPTSAPPTSIPPTSAPPASVPPTSAPPTSVPPTSAPPTSVPPTSIPPTFAPPTSTPPTSVPSAPALSSAVVATSPILAETPTLEPTPTDEVEATSAVNATPTRRPTVRPAPTQQQVSAPTQQQVSAPAFPATSACPRREVCITSPSSGNTLRGTVTLFGTAIHDNFSYYKFELLDGRCNNGVCHIASLYAPVYGGALIQWDTRRIPNGRYLLRLTVVGQNGGGYPQVAVISVNIAN